MKDKSGSSNTEAQGDATSKTEVGQTGSESKSDISFSEVSFAELQGIPEVSDAELQGISDDSEDAKDDETSKAASSESVSSKTDDAKSADASTDKSSDTSEDSGDTKDSKQKDTKSDSESSKDSDKTTEKQHPVGYVPLKAVQEAREENQYLKGQISNLTQQVTDLASRINSQKSTSETTKTSEEIPGLPKDFKVLSKDDFKELSEDNPVEASEYLYNLNLYQEHQRTLNASKAEQERTLAQNKAVMDTVADAVSKQMEQIVPGIFDEDSESLTELLTFADEIGFMDDMYYLTNPLTQVILPGESEPMLLGDQAADMLKLLVSAKDLKSKIVDEKAVEDRLRGDLTKEITEKVTAELIAKFKTDSRSFRSLSETDTTGDQGQDSLSGKVLSPEEVAKLSEADYQAYLTGNA